MENQQKDILVVPSAIEEQAKGAKSLFGGGPSPVRLNANALRENVASFMESVNKMLSGIPKVADPFKLDEIEITIEINAEGNIQLIGGVKAGATGGITLRLKR